MPQNFFVLTKVDNDIVYRLSLDQTMSEQMVEIFNAQCANFEKQYENEIDFSQNWSASLEPEQAFVVNNFEDINGIVKSISHPNSYDALEMEDISRIKGIYTGIETSTNITILIQSFNRSRAITKSKFALLKANNTFTRFQEEIIVLDSKLAGIFVVNKSTPTVGKLKFHSFYDIRQLFDMSEYYKEASDEQVEIFLANSLFEVAKLDKVNANSNWVKKKVGMIMQDKVLQNISIEKIMEACKKRKLEVQLNAEGKIQLPNNNSEFKSFLKLLAEDYFDGEFSGTTYSANSKIKIKAA